MRIICRDLGEFEIKHPLTPVGFDEFELAPKDVTRLESLICSDDVLERIDSRSYDSLWASNGIKRAVIIGHEGAIKTPYWGLFIELQMDEYYDPMLDDEEDFLFFGILDGLSVVQVNYPRGVRVFLSHDVGWGLPCTVTRYEGGRTYLDTPELIFADGRAVSRQASLLRDDKGYLVTHYLDYGDGVLRPREDRLEGQIIQPVVIWQRD